MLIDTHAHLNMEPLRAHTQEVFDSAVLAGVKGIVVPSIDIQTSKEAISIAASFPHIVAGIGIHPETVFETASVEELSSLITDPHVAAIGEIGLDYFRLPSADATKTVEAQRNVFRAQLALALEHSLPVIIHTRTEQAINDALDDIASVYGNRQFEGVFHCFTGNFEQYQHIESIGGFIGVGGIVTFTNSQDLQAVIANASLSNIVLETDSPLLAPQPHRGKTNIPANVTIVALKLADILSTSVSTVLHETGDNALRLFPKLKDTV